MLRIALFILVSSFSLFSVAENGVQKLFKAVNNGVVELHVKAIAQPEPGQVKYTVSTADSLGSGALISQEGRILTAAHVVDRATEIEVIFADGSKTSGHVVWVDALIDLAMIQAAHVPSKIKPLKLAKSGDYNIGEQVVVIGAPYGVSHSLSVGYLSGIRDREQIPGSTLIPRFLQTDAAINKGNSGGPMFNLDGEVIGIVSYILSNTGGSNGLGFVVSIDTVRTVMDSDPGVFSGFIPQLLNEKLAKALNNPHGYGMLIQQVIPGTLADKMGFRGGSLNILIGRTPMLLGGDILLTVGGHQLKDLESAVKLKKRMSTYAKGDKVEFRFIRDGVEKKKLWIIE
ncbi:MAG: trypsin-like peptidase domain-containing protein [Colwellia sp.]|nr:trypsin-like peptidase domain-containing protein [Colwellia sp.]